MRTLILVLAALVLVYLLLRWFVRTPPQQLVRWLRRGLLTLGGVVLLLLVASGRLSWLYAALGALLPFAQRLLTVLRLLPLVQQLRGWSQARKATTGPSPGQTSQVRTRFLRVSLDHDSGGMSGEVLEGRYAGHHLEALSLAQLLELLDECSAADAQSAAILEAYLDRVHGQAWREEAPHAGAEGGSPGARMTRAEAYEILGLSPGASRAEIIAAHRRLMQRFHPDRGGSTYLAAQINRAKDLLLAE